MENDDIVYTRPEPYDSQYVLPHQGLKVVIRQLNKIYSTNKLIDYVSDRFALKIARGYKIYVDDKLVQKARLGFDNKHQTILFRLNNGAKVYGSLFAVDKPKARNIDVLVRQVKIEGLDFDYKVEGWINCDELELTISRDASAPDEDTVYHELFNFNKLEEWLIKNGFERKDSLKPEGVKDKTRGIHV